MSHEAHHPLTGDPLDETLREFLGWHAEDLSGVPDRAAMLVRLRVAPRGAGRSSRIAVGLALALMAAAVATLVVALSRPSPSPVRLLGNGPIVIGMNAIDPETGWLVPGVPHLDDSAAVAADGSTMVHREDDAIRLVDLDRDTERELVPCIGCAINRPPLAISADGSTVSYAWQGALHVVDVATGTDRTVRRIPGAWEEMETAVSPDGSMIAYADGAGARIDVVDREGGPVWSVVEGTVPGCPECVTDVMSPAFSPDGRRLAWMVARAVVEVWVADVGSWQPRLAWQTDWCCVSLTQGLAWSPDGTHLAVLSRALWVVDPATGDGRRLQTRADGRPVWLPVPPADGWLPSIGPTASAGPPG